MGELTETSGGRVYHLMPTAPEGRTDTSRIVDARDRFAALMAPRPWHRKRKTILTVAGAILALVAVVLAVLLFLPAFRVAGVDVRGATYVDAATVSALANDSIGESIVRVPASRIESEAAEIPGVVTAEVSRAWPNRLTISVTEEPPVAMAVMPDGSSYPVAADGAQLPAAAAEGTQLPPLTVGGGAEDPQVALLAMADVVGALPEGLRGQVSDVTAATGHDVAFTVTGEEFGTKRVMWGDTRDAELKTQVVQTLLTQPGSEIDVSSPVAPVTR